jgi:hypothetical protein
MKRLLLRVTQWLGTIPVEAECTACRAVKFRAQSTSHRPDLAQYQRSLQAQFDEHLKLVHSEDASRTSLQAE